MKSISGRREAQFNELCDDIKKSSRSKKYDGIIGVSGGVDSSYLLHLLADKGLKPLVVHIDAGWNSIEAIENIYNLTDKLELDLETVVIDWNTMKDLQRAYLFSGVANQDVPQDHSFFVSLYDLALKYDISDVFMGSNFATESILPSSWGQSALDGKNIRRVYKKNAKKNLIGFKTHSLAWFLFRIEMGIGIKIHKPLNMINFDKDQALATLVKKYDFKNYGNKHSESVFTSYYQKIYLPTRFNIDKRKAHLSSLVVGGFITREQAMEELETRPSSEIETQNLRQYVASKLGLQEKELEIIENLPLVNYKEYGYAKVTLVVYRIYLKMKLILGLRK